MQTFLQTLGLSSLAFLLAQGAPTEGNGFNADNGFNGLSKQLGYDCCYQYPPNSDESKGNQPTRRDHHFS